MFADLRHSISDWIFRANVPEAPPVTLVQRRIFILPTRQGYTFAFTTLVLLVASINYALQNVSQVTSCAAVKAAIGA